MSFPPVDRDTGTHDVEPRGFVLGPDEGEAFWWLGSLTLSKVSSAVSGGGLDIVDHRVPAGYAPPMHIHRHSDEVFYVIDGEFDVRCGDEAWTATPGSLVFLPRQVPHGFTVSGAGEGRTLLINAPAGFADLVAEIGTRTTKLEAPAEGVAMPDADEARRASESHGIFQA